MQVNKINNNTNFEARIRINKDINNQMFESSALSGCGSSISTILSSYTSEGISDVLRRKSSVCKPKYLKIIDNIRNLFKGLTY